MANNKPYNNSVDVYAFGILLWELCSLDKPFKGYDHKKHMANVVHGGERPKLDTTLWPTNLQNLMKHCWSADPKQRPSFKAIKGILEVVLFELSDDNLEHQDGSTDKLSPIMSVKNILNVGNLSMPSLGSMRFKRSNSSPSG